MLNKNNNYDSQFIILNNVKYCPYCGKKLNKHIEHLGHYEMVEHYNCDCKDALTEYEIFNKIQNLKKEIALVSAGYRAEIEDLEKQMPIKKYDVKYAIVSIDYDN